MYKPHSQPLSQPLESALMKFFELMVTAHCECVALSAATSLLNDPYLTSSDAVYYVGADSCDFGLVPAGTPRQGFFNLQKLSQLGAAPAEAATAR